VGGLEAQFGVDGAWRAARPSLNTRRRPGTRILPKNGGLFSLAINSTGTLWTRAGGIAVIAMSDTLLGSAAGAALLGVGTAMVYPTLLAGIGDVALPSWRASAVGVYRFWRDLGYAIGAMIAGVMANLLGLGGAP
jgi:hypothetical protein